MSHTTLIKVDRGSTREMGLSAWPGGYKYTMGHPFFVPRTFAFGFAVYALCASLQQPNLSSTCPRFHPSCTVHLSLIRVFLQDITQLFSPIIHTTFLPPSLSPICPVLYCDLALCTHMLVFAFVTYSMHT